MSLLTYNAHFNSIKVRLEQIASSVDSINVAFQFHKGTIKTYMQKEGDGAKVNFNSIKVRLKQSIVHDNNKFILEFQFHKGTIKTYIEIKGCHIFLHFNSIKVRLKPSLGMSSNSSHIFQFHKGTIKTRSSQSLRATSEISIP